MSKDKVVLSAIQPTGSIHFGNYFGALENWVHLQETYQCFFGVVDYHALTMPFNPKKLRENSWDVIFSLLSVGIKPEHLFIQSLVPEHAELAWIFNCFCSYGQLSRMTQFKDKGKMSQSTSSDQFISAGLFGYPVLQAADILIYKADFVPVGKDQVQHLELTRNIAERFNNLVGKEYFTLPEVLFSKVSKVNSTADPTRKMSKSAGEKHYISIFADETIIRKKIRSAVTDTGQEGDEMSPGVRNLFNLLDACGSSSLHEQFMQDYKNGQLKYAPLKDAVAEALISKSSVFKEKLQEVRANKKEIKSQIKQSTFEIRKVAQQTVKEVKELIGLQNIRF